ncbi:MAG: serine/threonine protein kinase [Myxococcota bacterium]
MSASDSNVIVADDPLIGQSIGAYVVKSLLGDGGMAMVFLAEHQAIGRKMAVKVLKAEVAAQSEWGRRFVAEAQVVAALKHRNIVEVFDFGQLPDGRQFLMMEYVQGEPLAAYIEQHAPLIPAVALDFADQILNALGEAHKKGIVHRDLKPGNVMLVREHNNEPLLKVLDFGLARVSPMALQLEAGSQEAKTSLLAGTPAYVAPEQALGHVVDGRADLYALGVMLFEMLTGHLPFDARDDRDLVQMHVSTKPPRLDDELHNLPDGLADFVASLLAKSRDERPANADVARQVCQRIIKRIRIDATAVRPMPAPARTQVSAKEPTQKLEPSLPLSPAATTTDLALQAAKPSAGPRIALGAVVVLLLLLAVWAFWPTPAPKPVEPAVVPPPPPVEPVKVVAPEPPKQAAPESVVDAGAAEELVAIPLNATKPPPVKVDVRKNPQVSVVGPASCTFDDRFRDYARRTRDELKGMGDAQAPAFVKASDQLADALVERNCARANVALNAMRKAVGVEEE